MTSAAQLTDHDRQLLALLAAGFDHREIGIALDGIAPRTVRYHIAVLLRKFGAANVRELLGMFIAPDVFEVAASASSAPTPASHRV